jgi:nucleoside-diphosphate-sugar epimerase
VISAEQAIALGQPRTWIRYLTRSATYSIEKIQKLGYRPRIELAQGMDLTAQWLREAGLVPEAVPTNEALP